MPGERLAEYRRKRDFGQSPEPAGHMEGAVSGPLTFVVHKHAARRLHYDLRIECEGILLSFAIPRGPSARIGEKRLAVRTEDHPLDYASFEGVIPKGQYGAGSSIIWDAGTYSPDEGSLCFDNREEAESRVRQGLEAGKLSLAFRGRKLKGSWALVKTADAWLLLKHRDDGADRPGELTALDRSLLSDCTNGEIARGTSEFARRFLHFAPQSLPGARPAPMIPNVLPMLAVANKPIPAHGWSYEPKLDGIRVMATLEQGFAKLTSRRGNNVTATYPGIATAVSALAASSLTLDGEIVATGDDGRASFERLQQRLNLTNAGEISRAEATNRVSYYVFDVLYQDGFDLTAVLLEQRREVLARLLLPRGPLREVATIDLPPEEAFETAVSHGFEGLVAKRDGSVYAPGQRSDSWRKRKASRRGVFAVGGFTRGEGLRAATFGGLLLGERYPEGLVYRGRVGTGFSDAEATALRTGLDGLRRDASPFATAVPHRRSVSWVEPSMDVMVEYAEQTAGGILRAPVFKGMAGQARPGIGPNDWESNSLLDQLSSGHRNLTLREPGWTLGLTNLDKVLWPAHGDQPPVTKRDLLRHAVRCWPLLQPHVRDRLVTLTRYPDGITGTSFYQRHLATRRLDFVETVRVFSENDGNDKTYVLCNNLPTLLYLCQQAALEWHMSLSRITPPAPGEAGTTTFTGSADALEASVLNYPDILLFDLDSYIYRGDEKPGEEPLPGPEGFAAAKRAAVAVGDLLGELGVPSLVKTSGKTGLHVCVPVARTLDFGAVRAFATTLGRELVRRHSRLLTTEWHARKRTGKVFVDVNQNARARALVVPFSPRAHPGAPISMPIAWSRLEATQLGDFHLGGTGMLETAHPWQSNDSEALDLRDLLGIV